MTNIARTPVVDSDLHRAGFPRLWPPCLECTRPNHPAVWMGIKWRNTSKPTVAVASTVLLLPLLLLLLLPLPSMAQEPSTATATAPGPDPSMMVTSSSMRQGLHAPDFRCNANLTKSCALVWRDVIEGPQEYVPPRSILVADNYIFALYFKGYLYRCLPETIYKCTAQRPRCSPQTVYSCIGFHDLNYHKNDNKPGGAMAVLRKGTIIVASANIMVRTRPLQ
jgi:hypothetical protein